MQRLLSALLVIALLVTMFPTRSNNSVQAAVAHNFDFNNEQYTVGSARITTNERVNLTGTINNVNANSIKYSVYQINPFNEKVITSNENQTGNMTFSGSTINVFNVQLYPGMNKITFTGQSGASTISDSIYIEYRDSPMLFDLTAGLDGSLFNIAESETTVVHSTASRGKGSADISISGKAPNATKVSVIVNGKSNTYSISSSSDWSFVASPINVQKGMNLVTIRVFNNTQFVETTRKIAFYNGEVTYYDLKLVATDGTDTYSTPLSSVTNFSVPAGFNVSVVGKSIVPLTYTATPSPAFLPNPGWTWDSAAVPAPVFVSDNGQLTTASGPQIRVNGNAADTITNVSSTVPAISDKFFTVEFSEALGDSNGSLPFDTAANLQFSGWNQSKLPSPGFESSGLYIYKLRDSTEAYIKDINYIPGYSSTTNLQASESSDLENARLFSLPTVVEVLIGNYTPGWATSLPAGLVELDSITTATGTTTDGTDVDQIVLPDVEGNYDYIYDQLPNSYVTVINVDGVDTPFLRVFVSLNKLPNAGSMKLDFNLNHADATTDPYPEIPVTLLYGPYVKYDSVFDGMKIEYDTTQQTAGVRTLIEDEFDGFRGSLFNVPNLNTIRYATSGTDIKTVTLYVNNTEFQLEKESATSNINDFILPQAGRGAVLATDLPTIYTSVFSALNLTGDNYIKFVYRTATDNYESTTKVTIVPTNLPVIPAPNTDGVYPFSTNLNSPLPNDPNFTKQGPIFTTTEAKMNVFGSFDFIDLGKTLGDVTGKFTQLTAAEADGYILEIAAPDFATPMRWELGNDILLDAANPSGAAIRANSGDAHPSNLSVMYNYDTQSFSFILYDQQLPFDGSAKVYSITVYNSGLNGPRATYRLEVDPTSIPYTIISPRSEKRTMNQSFVEVILTSPGADSITVDKVVATKITYKDYGTLDGLGNPTEVPAFRALVTNLKANKATEIKLTIKNANDTINDSFDVTYAPENIPGAQTMMVMKNTVKAFGGALNLKFPSGTNLIRKDYNVADNLKGQVYKDNNLLVAIANPQDGVVDRHDFETIPFNYDTQLNMGEILFTASFPSRFVKASPVFWLDAGQADDPTTTASFDPVTYGVDPFPLDVIKGTSHNSYYNKSANRELIPSKRGELEMSYDPSMRQSAGTLITVFRFDPFVQQWENIGGVVDEKKNSVKVPFDRFGYYVVAKVSYGFNDVTAHPYAREAIEAIYGKGVMNAVDPSGAFGVDQYVTRGEFSRMLVRALGLPLNYDGPNHFVDVPNTGNAINMDALWDYRYIETAARSGFVRGTLPRVFNPDASISRQDAAVMLTKALNLKTDTSSTKVRATLAKVFKDETAIDFYAKPSVAAIQKKGFISGSPVDSNDLTKGYVFEPGARLLRGDASIIISRVMADLKKLPKLYN
ncbi:S-layer homology domain-containing protein [Cohnella sp.]|uniref:S-layer homology domain-containing protein n=1 Tax=Cohnella sp. TaxID=1883426 RepID=UPI0035647BF4